MNPMDVMGGKRERERKRKRETERGKER